MSDVVRLRVGGVVFEAEKESLLRFKHTFFYGLFSSGVWLPDADGAYFIDRPAMGFDRILEYLSSGKLSVDGLTQLEEECMYCSLDYLLIPYKKWNYDTHSSIEGFRANYVHELKDGRFCGAHGNDVIVWNIDTNAIEMTFEGHTNGISQLIQLKDGRVCSCSSDRTIKLWSTDSGLCELTVTGHTDFVTCIIQLFDGRVCSGSWDETIRVWNVLTGLCEMTINTQYVVRSIAQLADGRICRGGFRDGTISIYCLLTGECELSWTAHTQSVTAFLCIDASGSDDGAIKFWNIATGECERTLEGHSPFLTSMVLMQDGRLCSASWDGRLMLWNLETGECEKTLSNNSNSFGYQFNVIQLSDGRLVSCFDVCSVCIWS